MAVYGDNDLQAGTLAVPSSTHGALHGVRPPPDLLDFFSHSEMVGISYLVRFAHLVSLCLSCQLPTSASAPSQP